ncbi:MAG: hypothetical protein FWD15_03840 [Alphaproteobacteria bacterium]|nr:hypothetical protein [Alphaproteobacteria bacterium]
MNNPIGNTKDYTGVRIGFIEFIEITDKSDKYKSRIWKALCHCCGEIVETGPNAIKKRKNQVCDNCLKNEMFRRGRVLNIAHTKISQAKARSDKTVNPELPANIYIFKRHDGKECFVSSIILDGVRKQKKSVKFEVVEEWINKTRKELASIVVEEKRELSSVYGGG